MSPFAKRIIAAIPLLMIILYFLLFASIPLWDSDFFWHVKTGEYIAENREIPKEDPFSYATPAGDTLRKRFILGQYWLAQLILYYVWKYAGPAGIIIMRSCILSLILLLMYFLLRKRVEPLISAIFMFLSGGVCLYFTGERPQLFTFLGVVALIFIIEKFREKRGKIIYALPVLMLLWANLHGGVMLGVVLIFIYLISDAAALFFRFNSMGKKEYGVFAAMCLIAVPASLLNPNTYHLFTAFYQFFGSIGLQLTSEFLSPVVVALRFNKIFWRYFLLIAVAVALLPVILLLRRREIKISSLAILSFMFAISLVSSRYMIFAAVAFPLLAADSGSLVRDKFNRLKLIINICLLAFMCYSLAIKGMPSFRIHESYPDNAVEFIKKTKPKGNLFNYFEWGGYLIEMLPEYKVFIDGRGLDENIHLRYSVAITGSTVRYGDKYEWEKILDAFDVNIVLMPPSRIYTTGERIELIGHLTASPNWKLAYYDGKSFIFLRAR